ncbi:MAG: hypothetical protein LBR95_07005, partial [Azoarcus sp.]|nr:hypothetical protein [Azoarcus sp.]
MMQKESENPPVAGRLVPIDLAALGLDWDSLPDYEPEKTPKNDSLGAWDTAKLIGGQLLDAAAYHLPGAVAAAIEGDDPYGERDWKDALIERSNRRAKESASAHAPDTKTALPGISTQNIQSLGPSLAFSGVGAGAGLAAGIPAGVAGNLVAPVVGTAAGYGAGAAASGKAAYNMATNQFIRNLYDSVNEEHLKETGQPIRDEEFRQKQNELSGLINEYGLWEAVPEAIGNVAGFGILKAPVKGAIGKLFGKNVLTRLGTKMAGLYGGELATETLTQQGQHNVEVDAGLTDAPERSWTSPSDLADSFSEIAPETLLQTTLMAGGVKGGMKVHDRLKGRKSDPPPAPPPSPAAREAIDAIIDETRADLGLPPAEKPSAPPTAAPDKQLADIADIDAAFEKSTAQEEAPADVEAAQEHAQTPEQAQAQAQNSEQSVTQRKDGSLLITGQNAEETLAESGARFYRRPDGSLIIPARFADTVLQTLEGPPHEKTAETQQTETQGTQQPAALPAAAGAVGPDIARNAELKERNDVAHKLPGNLVQGGGILPSGNDAALADPGSDASGTGLVEGNDAGAHAANGAGLPPAPGRNAALPGSGTAAHRQRTDAGTDPGTDAGREGPAGEGALRGDPAPAGTVRGEESGLKGAPASGDGFQPAANAQDRHPADPKVSRETDSPVAQTAEKDAPPEETIMGKPAGQYSDATLQKFAKQKGPGGEKAKRELARRQTKAEETPPSPLRVGTNPKTARPVTVRDGVIHLGDEPAYDYETGEEVRIAEDATPQQLADAIRAAGAVSNREKFFGLKGRTGETRESGNMASMNPPRAAWGDFPNVLIHADESAVKQHPDYRAAKSGDADAAARLVADTFNDG